MDPDLSDKTQAAKVKTVSDEKAEAREIWYKTVVKVLKWKEGAKASGNTEPLTDKEWSAYVKETIKINAAGSREKSLKRLKEIEETIKKHGGFAKS